MLKAKKEKTRWLLYMTMFVKWCLSYIQCLTVFDVEVLFMHDKGLVSD